METCKNQDYTDQRMRDQQTAEELWLVNAPLGRKGSAKNTDDKKMEEASIESQGRNLQEDHRKPHEL